jgi:RHS repeat-associated protein
MRVTRWLTAAIALGGLVAAAPAWATQLQRASSFLYDPTTGLLTQETVQPGTALQLQTNYGYDAFGNKTLVQVVGADIVTRNSTSTYDSLGQFAIADANALGQSESWQYDARFGKPTSHTGPNGLTTLWSYDVYGRKIFEARPDGTETRWAYLFCSGYNGGDEPCPAGAVYLINVTLSADAGSTQNGPTSTVYYDMLDREVARDTQGFDNSIIRASKQYDSFGRVMQQSRPYFASGGTPQWTTYQYDALNRVVLETYPDSTPSHPDTTQHAYHGLTTVDTNANGQTRTTTKNSQGNVVAVKDAANNTTSYTYDPFDNLIQTADPVGNNVYATYDVRGRKTQSIDPDLGTWNYTYDTASELHTQTDAKGQTTTFAYDQLGRMTQRTEPDLASTWVYDTAANGIGKLASATASGAATGVGAEGFQRTFAYDSLSRPVQVGILINSAAWFYFSATYDTNSRLSSVTSPSGLVIYNIYTQIGYLEAVYGPSSQLYWQADARDAELRLIQETAGNGVVTTQNFDPVTDRLNSILAGSGNAVESFSYTYDTLGNVLSRADANENFSETFTYDNLNRLLSATVSAGIAPPKTFTYDATGNLASKSDVGTYGYPAAGSLRPHAVSTISVNGTVTQTFTYDANGNLSTGLDRGYAWYSFNKPNQISQGAIYQNFLYDTEHARFWKAAPEGGTLYFDAFGVHSELFISGTQTWYDYISAGGAMVAMQASGATVATLYFHNDNLGSIAVITGANGAVVTQGRQSYDAWGQRRSASGADGEPPASPTTRGFTGQEELSDVGLVHLNGRIYDPLLARMTSADPMVPDPMNGQAWNRYAYVVNNPLGFTDPSGYCFLGCGTWQNLGKMQLGTMFRQHPLLGSIVEIAAVGICASMTSGGCVPSIVAVLSSTVVAGITSGRLGKDVLRAGLTTAATETAFYVVGGLTNVVGDRAFFATHIQPDFDTAAYDFNVVAHAGVGCGAAVASGAKCGPGALAGAVTSAAGPVINGKGFSYASLAANAALGGGVAVLGGGKFENGAITGAFGYLFNACGGPHGCADLGRQLGMAGGIIGGGFLAATAEYVSIGLQTALVPVEIVSGGAIGGGFGQAVGSILDSIFEARKSPTLWCQNVECGAPHGGAFGDDLCPDCYNKLRKGGPPITLENGKTITEPPEPED